MSTLAEIADKNVDRSDAAANTGTLGCQIEFGTPLHALALKKGMIIPKATVFDKVYIDTQIQLGNFIPMIGADSFEEMSSEDSMNTNSRGVERLSMLGLPKYKLSFMLGHEFYKEISKLTSFKSMDFIFGDDEGNWKLAVTSAGDFRGFSAGQVLAHMTKSKVQGGEPESKSISMQMLNREQWDRNYAILGRSLLTFSPEEIDGINGVNIVLKPVVPTATSVSFRVVLSADNNTPVLGWTTGALGVYIDDVKVASVITEGVDGNYTGIITAQTAGKKIQVKSFDTTTSKFNVLVSGVIFNGDSNVVTVAV